jgi:hypothetical protein
MEFLTLATFCLDAMIDVWMNESRNNSAHANFSIDGVASSTTTSYTKVLTLLGTAQRMKYKVKIVPRII